MKKLKSLQVIEKEALQNTLKQTKGNIMKTTNILGCSRATVYRKIKEHNISIAMKRLNNKE